MALRINTNIAAMTAHKNMIKNDSGLSASLEKLSSGLRINRAADDASGMAIADALKSQSLGLGQAIRNANDGISMVQTADGALDESIKIVNTIKTKAIQAAQDGQTTDSRKAIQSDVNKLMEELNIIARTTAFNGQKLLSGNFTGKKFQIGAYAKETVSISIASAESTKVGHVTSAALDFSAAGTSALSIYSSLQNATFNLESIEVAYDNTRDHSVAAVADAINKLSDVLGLAAEAVVESTTANNITGADDSSVSTDSTFAINGVTIGAVTVLENDSNGALVKAINQKTDQHGVFASVDSEGILTLASNDGRAIDVTGGAETAIVMGQTADSMDTLGVINLTQTGTAEIVVNDRGGIAVSLATASGDLEIGAATVAAGNTMDLASGSDLLAGSVLAAGSTSTAAITIAVGGETVEGAGITLATGSTVSSGTTINSGSTINAAITIAAEANTADIVVATGSSLQSGTVLNSGSTIAAAITVEGFTATLGTTVLASGSILLAGSTLASGIAINTVESGIINVNSGVASTAINYTLIGDNTLTNGVGSDFIVNSGSILAVNSTASGIDLELNGTQTITGSLTLTAGSNIVSGSTLAAGSTAAGDDLDTSTAASQVITGTLTLVTGSIFTSGSILAAGSDFGGETLDADLAVTGTLTLAATSTIVSGSDLANGSTIGGTVTLLNAETVASGTDMSLGAGSTLASGSVITAGSVLSNDITNASGTVFEAGSVLFEDVTTAGVTQITNEMALNSGSQLAAGSTLAPNTAADAPAVFAKGASTINRLADVNLTTQEGAQIAIAVADSALKDLDKVRADLGSIQNQLNSTIANLSSTRVNIFAAESSIRDVDFAEEAANFSKMQILNQASSFAMAQANASSQTVLSLLQG